MENHYGYLYQYMSQSAVGERDPFAAVVNQLSLSHSTTCDFNTYDLTKANPGTTSKALVWNSGLVDFDLQMHIL